MTETAKEFLGRYTNKNQYGSDVLAIAALKYWVEEKQKEIECEASKDAAGYAFIIADLRAKAWKELCEALK